MGFLGNNIFIMPSSISLIEKMVKKKVFKLHLRISSNISRLLHKPLQNFFHGPNHIFLTKKKKINMFFLNINFGLVAYIRNRPLRSVIFKFLILVSYFMEEERRL